MPLTRHQQEALPFIEWLIADDMDNAGVGRTELLCHAFIQKAMKRPETPVRPFDHWMPWNASVHQSVNFFRRIRRILGVDYPEWDMVWNSSQQSFYLKRKTDAKDI